MRNKTRSADAEAVQSILVVDDDPKIVRLVRSYLEQSGFRVESVNDGNRALQAIHSLRAD